MCGLYAGWIDSVPYQMRCNVSQFADTIYALSSGGLPAGVAVIRVSGNGAFAVASQIAGQLPAPRTASLRTIRTRNGLVIDNGIVLLFPGPNSFTGEDCAEFQVHGGLAVVAAILDELSAISGCRLAENGEFSRRAFENGRMDLLEAEGLADLLAAETEMQRRLAIEQSNGGLSELYAAWANRITRARALIEAELDFSDEADVPGSVSDQVWADMRLIRDAISDQMAGAKFGEIVRDGFRVAIAGPPNSGKSTLLNALAGRDVAIVTEIAGTTRDVLEVNLDIDGFRVRLFDTAGVRDTEDVVEAEGVKRALQTVEAADLVLVLREIGSPETEIVGHPDAIHVGTKADIHGPCEQFDICISVQDGTGLAALKQRLSTELGKRSTGLSMAVPARRRHRVLLEQTISDITCALNSSDGLDIRAEHLRAAARSLGRITGHVDVEDLLGVIFSEFCVGK